MELSINDFVVSVSNSKPHYQIFKKGNLNDAVKTFDTMEECLYFINNQKKTK